MLKYEVFQILFSLLQVIKQFVILVFFLFPFKYLHVPLSPSLKKICWMKSLLILIARVKKNSLPISSKKLLVCISMMVSTFCRKAELLLYIIYNIIYIYISDMYIFQISEQRWVFQLFWAGRPGLSRGIVFPQINTTKIHKRSKQNNVN